ncbi:hypothetical protein [Kitasatospora brasiliensis]|uniref:hypothetical protein n=1 Tax=Kitasatospora brasiliensis TaxID=3058040 RepID=UPI0029313E6F|nr:hypothetical protein [Kitasatospora sp. K002]
MAAIPAPRRRPGAIPVAALAGLAVLVALAAVTFGRPTPGGLHDQGPVAVATPPAEPRPLWPQLPTSPPPAATAANVTPEPPQPVPDLTVPGRDITAVDVRTVLAKDPKVSQEERQALTSCTGCEIRSPEFRDLTGDGRPELITVVAVPGLVVLHVYALAEDHLLPVLRVPVQQAFSAATIGPDLWLYEPTSAYVQTTSHYQWDGARLALRDRTDEGVGVLPPTGQSAGSSTGPDNGRAAATATPVPGTAPARPAPLPPKQPAPEAAVPSLRTARPTAPPNGPSAPSAPAVFPEAKR